MTRKKANEHHQESRAARSEALDDRPIIIPNGDSLEDIIVKREMSRRELIRQGSGFAGVCVGAMLTPINIGFASTLPQTTTEQQDQPVPERFGFSEISHGIDEYHHVAAGHRADVLIRWGDPIHENAPEFDPYNQTAARQMKQFGYNNDYQGYIPLPLGSNNPDHGLLCINHEYTNPEVMFPDIDPEDLDNSMKERHIAIEMAAHGGTIIEIKRERNGRWQLVKNSPYNRRITATTPMLLSGPAAGHLRVKTNADPTGHHVIGTLNNCAGGITPWGTYLMAEENFHFYFSGELSWPHPEYFCHRRYRVPSSIYSWSKYHQRFNINQEPREANRFGWIVEVDPFDPAWTPRKRTSLGRFSHEGAECVVNNDGRLVVYSGDDSQFEYVYKFVSRDRVDMQNRRANLNLLDHGTLYVAKFYEDGTLSWLPLVYGSGPLTEANGIYSQADVLIETRRAADLLGATPMDRPEDVEPSVQSGKVYIMLTGNAARRQQDTDAVNPRARNHFGHVVELTCPGGDHSARQFSWEILVKCGDPSQPTHQASWQQDTSSDGWFANPDNLAIDSLERVWIASDQGTRWHLTGTADGIWGLETTGPQRGKGKMFFRVPVGAEMCGPVLTSDASTLFVAVQHPATDGVNHFEGFNRPSTFFDPATRWPDFDPEMPPRPAVVAITKIEGGPIGTS